MTKSVGVHEAKTQLSKLLERVTAGEVIIITRRGEEIARLVPSQPTSQRRFGLDHGSFSVPEDFDAPLPDEILNTFEH
jgi:prevent-host-death family protein